MTMTLTSSAFEKSRHRYFFRLYALDTTLPHLERPTRSALEKTMKGHVIAEAQLMWTYQKH